MGDEQIEGTIRILKINCTEVTIPSPLEPNSMKGTYFQMEVEDDSGIHRGGNLFFNYEGKQIYIVDVSNNIKITFLNEELSIGECNEGQRLAVSIAKIVPSSNIAAVLIKQSER